MKECIKRSLRTFFQTAVSYIAVNIQTFTNDGDLTSYALKGLVISACAAGIAAVMNIKVKHDTNGKTN